MEITISNKALALEEILKIDEEIAKIKSDSTYAKLNMILKTLDENSSRNRMITVFSPQDLKNKIRVKPRSKELKKIKEKYVEQVFIYEKKIRKLREKKKKLREIIFA